MDDSRKGEFGVGGNVMLLAVIGKGSIDQTIVALQLLRVTNQHARAEGRTRKTFWWGCVRLVS